MLLILLSLLSRLFLVEAQCSLEGAFAEALDKFSCLPISTLIACKNLYDPIKLDNIRSDQCAPPRLTQAYERLVECINNCGNDGPCGEDCRRKHDAEFAQIMATCDAAYQRDLAEAKCDAYDCYQSLSCTSAPDAPGSNPGATPDPDPKPSVPPVNPGTPSSPPPTCPKRPDYHQLTCQVSSNFACLNPNSNTKLVQRPTGKPNGCGPAGDGYEKYLTQFLAFTVPQFRSACNTHDICFGTCSFGDDAQFEICNANLFTSSVKICYDNYATLFGAASSVFEGCLAEAQLVYEGVQFGGCGAYNNAQQGACDCVPCDNVPMSTNQITLDLLSAVQSVCAGIVSSITNAWPTFTRAIDTAAQAANDVDRAALQFYAGQIGSSSPTTSSRITGLSNACGQGSRRKRNTNSIGSTNGNERRDEASLSSFFTGLASADPRTYACGPNDAQGVCETATALLEIARLSRQIDSYAGSTQPSTGSSNSSSIASSTSGASSSSTTSAPGSVSVSSIQSVLPSPSTSSSTSQSATGFSSSVPTLSASSAPSKEPGSPIGEASSTIIASALTTASPSDPIDTDSLPSGPGQTTSSAGQPSTGQSYATSAQSFETTATASVPAASCALVKTYGDSPDNGQPELPEIPDYPGGYYYLCQDGSIPPLSILPFPYGSGTVPVSVPNSTSTSSSEPPGLTEPAGCVWTTIYGDSPDKTDSPDSPDGQPEIPETAEIPQDGAYYWQCI